MLETVAVFCSAAKHPQGLARLPSALWISVMCLILLCACQRAEADLLFLGPGCFNGEGHGAHKLAVCVISPEEGEARWGGTGVWCKVTATPLD